MTTYAEVAVPALVWYVIGALAALTAVCLFLERKRDFDSHVRTALELTEPDDPGPGHLATVHPLIPRDN